MNNSDNIIRKAQQLRDQKCVDEYRKARTEIDNYKKKDKYITKLTVPNKLIFMRVNENQKVPSALTPVQLKILIFFIKEIQEFIVPQLEKIKAYKKEPNIITKLAIIDSHNDLFKKISDPYESNIPKKLFVSGRNYKHLKQEIIDLAETQIHLMNRDALSNEMALKAITLFSIVKNAVDKKNQRTVPILIKKEVLMLLSGINIMPKGKANWRHDYFCKVGYEIIMNCRKKYTGLLYLFLCSWKNAGGWTVNTKELRKLLGIPNGKFKRDVHFKQWVLSPAAEELKGMGDFWFKSSFKGKNTRFKIFNSRSEEENDKKSEEFKAYLMAENLFSNDQIKELRKLISKPQYHPKAKDIILNCQSTIFAKESTSDPVKHFSNYTFKALKNFNDKINEK